MKNNNNNISDNLNLVINNITDKFENVVHELGPGAEHAWSQIIGHTVVTNIGQIAFKVILLLTVYTICFISYKSLIVELNIKRKRNPDSTIMDIFHPIFWIFFMLSIIFSGFLPLTIIENLGTVFYPEGYILKELISGVSINNVIGR